MAKETINETLEDFMGNASIEFPELVDKHGDKKVVAEVGLYSSSYRDRWFPSRNHKNVHVWVILEDGSAVGLNENPAIGFGFPRVGKRTMWRYYPDIMEELGFDCPKKLRW